MKKFMWGLITFSVFVLTACGGGGSGGVADNPPTIDSFSINQGASATTDEIVTLSLSASDDDGIIAYNVSEQPATPDVFDAGWTAITQTSTLSIDFNFSFSVGGGQRNVYAWVKDTNDNISTVASDDIYKLMGGTAQPKALNLTGSVTTLTTPDMASYQGMGITTDGKYLFVSDYNHHVISKIDKITGTSTLLAGQYGVSGSTDGIGSTALFNGPDGITCTDGETLYVADSGNYTIRKISVSTGEVTTIAGSAGLQGYVDDIGSSARFNYPKGVTTDGFYLYLTDDTKTRKIDLSDYNVTSLSGFVDGNSILGTGIVTDGTYNYVSDGTRGVIYKFDNTTGLGSVLAGTMNSPGYADGIGTAAKFSRPQGITSDGQYLYVADSNNQVIRKIEISTGTVTTIAGTVGVAGSDDGTGSSATFQSPYGVTSDGVNLFVAQEFDNNIRVLD